MRRRRMPRGLVTATGLLVLALLAAACDSGFDYAESVGIDAAEGARGPMPAALEGQPMTAGDGQAVAVGGQAVPEGAVTFTDVGADLGYAHQFPARFARSVELFEATVANPVTIEESGVWPADPTGTAGVALVDVDGDEDLDLYVTNSLGAANSLFVNQLRETGTLELVEAAAAAGVDATDHESTGVCHGDVDNDLDSDLFVVGNGSPHLLFLNDGTGTFTVADGLKDEPSIGGTTCAMGDVTGDGLLDIAVGHTFDHATTLALVAEPFAFNLHNELLVQQPDGRFVDEAEGRGLHRLAGVPEGAAGITWAVALVDVDADGDLDLVTNDDQATLPTAAAGGVDRGFIQIHANDGTGSFTPVDLGQLVPGAWMGTAWADLDCDGQLDLFASNFGDYGFPTLGLPYELGALSSRWLLADGEGGFTDPGVGDLGATHFAWGGVAEDFDNDGDPDLLFHGGVDLALSVDLSNPGTFLVNEDCSADFTWHRQAFDVNHVARQVSGTAAGDLDLDGFVDVVTVSAMDVPEGFPIFPMPAQYGLPTDGTGFFSSRFATGEDGRFTYLGNEYAPGSLTVELNRGGNGNGSVAVRPIGSFGLVDDAVVPRSGYGAVVTVTPEGGRPFTKPLQGGTGYLSADSPVINAGLGTAATATVEIRWPEGVVNRYADVPAGTTLLAPELPCPVDEQAAEEHSACVAAALAQLVGAGVLDAATAAELQQLAEAGHAAR